jgi:hypothetical protein
MTLSVVYGTAFAVDPSDEIVSHRSVRVYRTQDGKVYIGQDTQEIVHVCDAVCLTQALPREYLPTTNSADAYVSIHPSLDGIVRTADVGEFDPGDDPYILCDACETELLRDDAAFLVAFGHPISNNQKGN